MKSSIDMPFTYQSNMPWDIQEFSLSSKHGSHLVGSSSSGYQIHCLECHRQNQKQQQLQSECQCLFHHNLPTIEKKTITSTMYHPKVSNININIVNKQKHFCIDKYTLYRLIIN